MLQVVTSEFSKIEVTTGTVQNISRLNSVEISSSKIKGDGLILTPDKKISFENLTLYARCSTGAGAEIRVVPFITDIAGGDDDDSLEQEITLSGGEKYRIASYAEVVEQLNKNFGTGLNSYSADTSGDIVNGKLRIAKDEDVAAVLDKNFGTEG